MLAGRVMLGRQGEADQCVYQPKMIRMGICMIDQAFNFMKQIRPFTDVEYRVFIRSLRKESFDKSLSEQIVDLKPQ